MLEIPHCPADATVGEEVCFALSLESLEYDSKRMKLSLSYECIESGELSETEEKSEKLHEEEPADSPERPDEIQSSEIFVVEGHAAPEEFVSNSQVLEYLCNGCLPLSCAEA